MHFYDKNESGSSSFRIIAGVQIKQKIREKRILESTPRRSRHHIYYEQLSGNIIRQSQSEEIFSNSVQIREEGNLILMEFRASTSMPWVCTSCGESTK